MKKRYVILAARGTTIANLIRMLKEAGAKKITSVTCGWLFVIFGFRCCMIVYTNCCGIF